MNELPNPLTPADRAVIRQTFAIFETIVDPYVRAEKQAHLIISCIAWGVSVRLVVSQ